MRVKGLLITLEGIDGVGKTTHLNRLKSDLELLGEKVLVTKEPGDTIPDEFGNEVNIGSNIGYQIRELLFHNPTTKNMAPGVCDMLFLADHVQVTEQVIKPALDKGTIVLCDRYADSEFAYAKSDGKRVPYWALQAWDAASSLIPDITILLTGNPKILAERSENRTGKDKEKQEGKVWANLEDLSRVQDEYINRLSSLKRTISVDVTYSDVEEVHNAIWSEMIKKLQTSENDPQQLSLPFKDGQTIK